MIAGVFITLDYKVDGNEVWTPEMKKIARSLKRFKVAGAAEKYPRLQHWHCARANLRNREETLLEGLPNLPALLGLNKKALIPKQSDFDYWHATQEED